MTNSKSIKRSLFSSVSALLVCSTMFLGTTFAWFTDSVTSSNNIIQSGNLDVELYYQAEGKTDWTKVNANTNVFMENALWEPGHTEVVKLKVVNEGSLALKYNLGVNVASETGSVNVEGKDFLLSDYIKYGIVDGAQTYTREQAVTAVEATATKLNQAYNSGTIALEAKNDTNSDEKVVTMVVYMPQEVGNEANFAKDAAVPTINLGLNLFATQYTAENDSFGNQYDKDAIIVSTADEAQAALDSVEAGAMIKLAPGVDYGTLYLRPYAGGSATKNVDWVGNNYGWETYSCFEDVTIVGAEGATVDAIEVEGGTYYHTEHSQDASYPVMLSLVELKNVVIDGVTFTGKGGYDPQGHGNAINLSGNNIKVDGLTLKNCVLENESNNARLLYKTESTTHVHTYTYGGETFTFSPSLKDITVTGCTFNGGYIGLEIREAENVTITNNEFNVADRNILLPVNSGYTYTGNITITGNVSNNAKQRFVRMAGAGASNVVIKDNTISNYRGEDSDFIKVTDSTATPTIENNTISYGSTESVQEAINAGQKNIVLAEGEFTLPTLSGKEGMTIIGAADGSTVIGGENANTGFGGNFGKDTTMTNLTFSGSSNGVRYSYANGGDTTFNNCVFAGDSVYGFHIDSSNGATFTFNNCTFKGFNAFAGDLAKVVFNNCTFLSNGHYGHTNIWSVAELNNCTFGGNTSIGTRGDSAHIFFDGVEESYYHAYVTN